MIIKPLFNLLRYRIEGPMCMRKINTGNNNSNNDTSESRRGEIGSYEKNDEVNDKANNENSDDPC